MNLSGDNLTTICCFLIVCVTLGYCAFLLYRGSKND